ncbi:MAG: PD-(D/E)XK nuclease family protein [Actinobacteria bacterium]|nr:PD-(D/E)XK nuclease family protein [Actinomycetota bacterium]
MDAPGQLSPTQQRVLEQLRREREPVVFDQGFVDQLVARAHEAMLRCSERLGGERLFVSKGFLLNVLGCETRHLEPDVFAWTPLTARGFVAHKAIELGVHWHGEPVPEVLVDEAIARLSDDPTQRGDWIAGLSDSDRAELRCAAVERVTQFLQDFPPVPGRFHPVYEARTRWTCGCVELSGKTDLVIGRPDGRASTKLIVDFKSGRPNAHHREDLRFYALLETLARQVPPRRLVTYYLESAVADAEDVTEAVLEASLARLIGAVERHVELVIDARPPQKRTGVSCRWCHVLARCDEGRAHLAMLDDDGSQGFDDPD